MLKGLADQLQGEDFMKFMDVLATGVISSSFRLEILNNHCRELALPHHHN